MNKFIDTLKAIDPTILIAAGLMFTFAAGLIVGQQTTSHEVKKPYIVGASEAEVVYHNPYKALTLDECEVAQLPDDQANGRFVSPDDPIFFPGSVPVIEPIDCGTHDKECEKANKNAGKSAAITHERGTVDSNEG